MECKVELVWESNTKQRGLFEVRNVSQHNDTFTHKSSWIQWDPSGVSQPKYIYLLVIRIFLLNKVLPCN